MSIIHRPRRNRRNQGIRALVQETTLSSHDFVLPIFLTEGSGKREPIAAMPGVFRQSPDELLKTCKEAIELKIPAIAIFPKIADNKKDSFAKESKNKNGLLHTTIKKIKDAYPDLVIITDIAMDPYSSDGHDGLVKDKKILNDETIEILCEQALSHAEVGADIVAPSDMMDGRIGAIRNVLDESGYTDIGILSYCAKYASSFYGPFREALDSAPKSGDKKTYQMDPANRREALREMALDEAEGADILMVKPALAYLDVIAELKSQSLLPIAAYHVSGEYSMIKAAAERGWINGDQAMLESLLSIKRAGADIIFTYAAMDMAKLLKLN